MSSDLSGGEFFILNQTFKSLLPVTLLSSNETAIFKQHKYEKSHHRLPRNFQRPLTFHTRRNIIIVSSHDSLHSALNIFRNSLMWNPEGFFIIVSQSGCQCASDFLKLMWEFNVLSATLLCSGSDHGPRLHTYNPFTNYAPDFWSVNQTWDDNSWTLFRHDIPNSFQLNGKLQHQLLMSITDYNKSFYLFFY